MKKLRSDYAAYGSRSPSKAIPGNGTPGRGTPGRLSSGKVTPVLNGKGYLTNREQMLLGTGPQGIKGTTTPVKQINTISKINRDILSRPKPQYESPKPQKNLHKASHLNTERNEKATVAEVIIESPGRESERQRNQLNKPFKRKFEMFKNVLSIDGKVPNGHTNGNEASVMQKVTEGRQVTYQSAMTTKTNNPAMMEGCMQLRSCIRGSALASDGSSVQNGHPGTNGLTSAFATTERKKKSVRFNDMVLLTEGDRYEEFLTEEENSIVERKRTPSKLNKMQ